MIWFVIVMIVYAIIVYTHPWFDFYTDYRGVKHLVLWYTNYKAERVFINLIGNIDK